MTAPTHIVAGISTMSFVALLIPVYKLSLTHIIVGAIAAMLPDVDNPRSFIGRLLFFASGPIDRKFGHRTITHSLLATFIVGGTSYLSLYIVSRSLTQYAALTATIVIAYFSHIFFDATTKQGVQIYYPARVWGVFPTRASWRIRTGSKPEIIFFAVFLVSALIFLPLGQSGMIQTFNRLFMVKQVDIRLRELEAKLEEASHGYTENEIDSLLRINIIDPKRADEMKSKRRKAELEIEKFKIDQGMNQGADE
jgi:inner membrane protein